MLTNIDIVNSRVGKYELTKVGNTTYLYYNGHFMFNDSSIYVTHYCKYLLYKTFNSLLCIGLGLGLVPHYFKDKDVDVVEPEGELIDLLNTQGYLDEVNIINENVLDYKPDKKYDIIICDLHYDKNENFEKQRDIITKHYKDYLNSEGEIYFPISQEVINKDDIPDRGLGDSVERIAGIFRIPEIMKAVGVKDCGCNKRKMNLNNLVKY